MLIKNSRGSADGMINELAEELQKTTLDAEKKTEALESVQSELKALKASKE